MIDTKQRAKYILEEYANCYSQVDLEQLAKYLDEIKAEAYKEFAESVNSKINKTIHIYKKAKKEHKCDRQGIPVFDNNDICCAEYNSALNALKAIKKETNNLLKELVGDSQ